MAGRARHHRRPRPAGWRQLDGRDEDRSARPEIRRAHEYPRPRRTALGRAHARRPRGRLPQGRPRCAGLPRPHRRHRTGIQRLQPGPRRPRGHVLVLEPRRRRSAQWQATGAGHLRRLEQPAGRALAQGRAHQGHVREPAAAGRAGRSLFRDAGRHHARARHAPARHGRPDRPGTPAVRRLHRDTRLRHAHVHGRQDVP